MKKQVLKQDVQKLIGKQIYALKKDGTVVEGKLVRVSGNQVFIAPRKGKQVKTSAILPLVLFDLLAVGTAPFGWGGGYGYGYGGYPYGGYGYGGFGGPFLF
ncbi:50S ribosomal protein L33 [Paenibacillus cremeus]|uniref:50S ribosomal protein L33 n=1 Tax=Paenibacillus cremeus TaxID=2163881 RepID=A0A559KC89_9BACL|nr:50S ribosomal protein L33 [Paenibacillus cremeus]TVY09750.1 50S ribosomal protein L33 [Paenibacillus cremeus]